MVASGSEGENSHKSYGADLASGYKSEEGDLLRKRRGKDSGISWDGVQQ